MPKVVLGTSYRLAVLCNWEPSLSGDTRVGGKNPRPGARRGVVCVAGGVREALGMMTRLVAWPMRVSATHPDFSPGLAEVQIVH